MKHYHIIFSMLLLFVATSLSSQCYPDRHSTNWFDGWASCDESPNPNPERGNSHWIMYDFGTIHQMGTTHFWNYNDPSNLDWGLEDVWIDYSIDGTTWVSHGLSTFQQATGKSIYEGFEGPNLEGVEAQYLLITAKSNFGGDCFGFSEVRLETRGITTGIKDLFVNDCFTVKTFPNPFSEASIIEINSTCEGEMEYSLMDVFGRMVNAGQIYAVEGKQTLDLNTASLPSGNYMLSVSLGENRSLQKLIKINP